MPIADASPFDVETVELMEAGVFNENLTVPTRFLQCFSRLGVGTSTRVEDRQRTPPEELYMDSHGGFSPDGACRLPDTVPPDSSVFKLLLSRPHGRHVGVLDTLWAAE